MQVNEKRTDNKSKKSKTIIVAAIVLMLCLITTCVVGTTLAKYTTSGSGSDSAQVAKWGVKIEILGDKLFNNEYKNSSNAVTVKSTSDVVAPGTSGSTTFSISGTPEVALNVSIDFDMTSDVYLYTYHPLVFTLKQVRNYAGDVDVTLKSGTLKEIETYLSSWSNKNYNPNTVLDATFELSWEWKFDGEGESVGANDVNDTLLGDLIAATDPTSVVAGITSDDYSTQVGFTLSVTATQID